MILCTAGKISVGERAQAKKSCTVFWHRKQGGSGFPPAKKAAEEEAAEKAAAKKEAAAKKTAEEEAAAEKAAKEEAAAKKAAEEEAAAEKAAKEEAAAKKASEEQFPQLCTTLRHSSRAETRTEAKTGEGEECAAQEDALFCPTIWSSAACSRLMAGKEGRKRVQIARTVSDEWARRQRYEDWPPFLRSRAREDNPGVAKPC